MVSSVSSAILNDKKDFEPLHGALEICPELARQPYKPAALLRIPPFPGACQKWFGTREAGSTDRVDFSELFRQLRVGGTYWGTQPELPESYVLVRSIEAFEHGLDLGSDQVLLWAPSAPVAETLHHRVIRDECDPWHMLSAASAAVVEANDEVRVIAALLGVPRYLVDHRRRRLEFDNVEAASLLADALSGPVFENPFTGKVMSVGETLELCGSWRRLIDANRDIGGGVGFATWKRRQAAPLLWGGSGQFNFVRNSGDLGSAKAVAAWRTKISSTTVADAKRRNVSLVEVEDGFLRSKGLGAHCIPPLSLTVDRLRPHFDPLGPSELENLLQDGKFDEELLGRAREVRRLIIDAGLGKYEQGTQLLERPAGQRRHILVPGQVEDDRAVLEGGCGLVSNLELLGRVRQLVPDAYILYKPHPDVVAGHRRGAIAPRACLEVADEIVGNLPIAALIEMVDEVHVNTSLAGFEALLRGKEVTTFGVPFYAGWGLTRDLGQVPSRRSTKRNIDELVAAALLLYPRYLDPVTGLPCPVEILISRLSEAQGSASSPIIAMRRLQGKFMRVLRSLVQ